VINFSACIARWCVVMRHRVRFVLIIAGEETKSANRRYLWLDENILCTKKRSPFEATRILKMQSEGMIITVSFLSLRTTLCKSPCLILIRDHPTPFEQRHFPNRLMFPFYPCEHIVGISVLGFAMLRWNCPFLGNNVVRPLSKARNNRKPPDMKMSGACRC
jgi:hypothetical protein